MENKKAKNIFLIILIVLILVCSTVFMIHKINSMSDEDEGEEEAIDILKEQDEIERAYKNNEITQEEYDEKMSQIWEDE